MTKKSTSVNHQFGIFGFSKPKNKFKIERDKIIEAKKKFQEGDMKASARLLNEVNDRLEEFCRRKRI
jgi:hypothetical protein